MKSNPAEIFPLVNEDGAVVGSATRARCHDGSKLLHPVVHLHVLGAGGSIYLQKRAMTKDIQPGKWDTAVGGHVDYGETPQQAVLREAAEELGIDAAGAELVERYVFESAIERELVHTFFLRVDEHTFAPRIAADEIDEARFWTPAQLAEAKGCGVLTPNLEMELERILPKIAEI